MTLKKREHYSDIKQELDDVKVKPNRLIENSEHVNSIMSLINQYYDSEHRAKYNSKKFAHIKKGYCELDSMRDYFTKMANSTGKTPIT